MKFFNNSYENVILKENAKFKNICIQSGRSDGYFHKFLNGSIKSDSKYSSFIFSSGLKFNKQDIQIDLEGKNSDCEIKSALFLNKEDPQEIKTLINHLVPNCKSFQKIKSVLDSNAKGVYQGKIFVKDIAQKTNAYQLSKALLISENLILEKLNSSNIITNMKDKADTIKFCINAIKKGRSNLFIIFPI